MVLWVVSREDEGLQADSHRMPGVTRDWSPESMQQDNNSVGSKLEKINLLFPSDARSLSLRDKVIPARRVNGRRED